VQRYSKAQYGIGRVEVAWAQAARASGSCGTGTWTVPPHDAMMPHDSSPCCGCGSTTTERFAFAHLLMPTEPLYMHILYAHKISHRGWLVITPVGTPPPPR